MLVSTWEWAAESKETVTDSHLRATQISCYTCAILLCFFTDLAYRIIGRRFLIAYCHWLYDAMFNTVKGVERISCWLSIANLHVTEVNKATNHYLSCLLHTQDHCFDHAKCVCYLLDEVEFEIKPHSTVAEKSKTGGMKPKESQGKKERA